MTDKGALKMRTFFQTFSKKGLDFQGLCQELMMPCANGIALAVMYELDYKMGSKV